MCRINGNVQRVECFVLLGERLFGSFLDQVEDHCLFLVCFFFPHGYLFRAKYLV